MATAFQPKLKALWDAADNQTALKKQYPELEEALNNLEILTDGFTDYSDPTAQELDKAWAGVLQSAAKSKTKAASKQAIPKRSTRKTTKRKTAITRRKTKAKSTRKRTTSTKSSSTKTALKTGMQLTPSQALAFRHIERYHKLHGRTVSADEILKYLRPLQRDILRKRITKRNKFADRIETIQDELLRAYRSAKKYGAVHVHVRAVALHGELGAITWENCNSKSNT